MEFTPMERALIIHLVMQRLDELEKFLSDKSDAFTAYFVREESIPTLKSILAKLN